MRLTVSDDILCEIGRIAVYQSLIEGQMALFIRELLYLDEAQGNLKTSKLRFWDLIKELDTLLNNEFGAQNKYVQRFKKFREEMKDFVSMRNNCVHSMWGFGPTLNSGSATRVKANGAVLESVTVTLEELQGISKALNHLEWEIGDIRAWVCHHEASARLSRT